MTDPKNNKQEDQKNNQDKDFLSTFLKKYDIQLTKKEKEEFDVEKLSETQKLKLKLKYPMPLEERRRLSKEIDDPTNKEDFQTDKFNEMMESEGGIDRKKIAVDDNKSNPLTTKEDPLSKVIKWSRGYLLNIQDKYYQWRSAREYNRQKKFLEKNIEQKNKQNNKLNFKDKGDQDKSRKYWLWISFPLVFLILVILIFAFFQRDKSYSIDEIQNTFTDAILQNETKTLKDIVEVKNEKLYYSDNFQGFIRLYNSDKDFKEKVENTLQEDVDAIKNGQKSREGFIQIVKNKSFSLFGKKYRLLLETVEVDVIDDTLQIGLNNEKVILADNSIQLLPGVYDIYKDVDILNLSNTITIDDKRIKEEKIEIDFDFSNATIANEKTTIENGDKSIQIKDGDPNGIVFINNENTDLTVQKFNELGNINIGEGNNLSVVSKAPWGYVFSQQKMIDEEEGYSLPVNYINEQVKDDIYSLIRKTLQNDRAAFMTSDPSKLTTLTGTATLQSTGWITLNKALGQGYVRNYQELYLDPESFEISPQGQDYRGYIGGFITLEEGKFRMSDGPESVGVLEEKRNQRVGFHFNYDLIENRWKMNLWGTTTRNLEMERSIAVELD